MDAEHRKRIAEAKIADKRNASKPKNLHQLPIKFDYREHPIRNTGRVIKCGGINIRSMRDKSSVKFTLLKDIEDYYIYDIIFVNELHKEELQSADFANVYEIFNGAIDQRKGGVLLWNSSTMNAGFPFGFSKYPQIN